MVVTLGRTSSRRLATCATVWREIVRAAAADPDCPCDFGVVCGWRGEEKQNDAYSSGVSNARWGESDHNFRKGDKPFSLAVDLAPYDPGIKNYKWKDLGAFNALASHILSTAIRLGYSVEWGGRYKLRDGKGDPGHFSLLFK